MDNNSNRIHDGGPSSNERIGSSTFSNIQMTNALGQAKALLSRLQQGKNLQQSELNYKLVLKGLSELNDGVITSGYLTQTQKTSLNEILMATNNLTQALAIQFTNNDIPSHIYTKLQVLVENLCNLVNDTRFNSEMSNASQLVPGQENNDHLRRQLYQQNFLSNNRVNSPSYVTSRLHQKFSQQQDNQYSQPQDNQYSQEHQPTYSSSKHPISTHPNRFSTGNIQLNRSGRLGILQNHITNSSSSLVSYNEDDLINNTNKLNIRDNNKPSQIPGPLWNERPSSRHFSKDSTNFTLPPPPPNRFNEDEENSEFDDEESQSHDHKDGIDEPHHNNKQLYYMDSKYPTQSYNVNEMNNNKISASNKSHTPLHQNIPLNNYNTPMRSSVFTEGIPPANNMGVSNLDSQIGNNSRVRRVPARRRPQSMYVTSETNFNTNPTSQDDSAPKRASFLSALASRRNSTIYDKNEIF